MIDTLLLIAKWIGKLKISQIVVPSMPIVIWIIYYLVVFSIVYILNNKRLWKIVKSKIKSIALAVGFLGIVRNNIFYI